LLSIPWFAAGLLVLEAVWLRESCWLSVLNHVRRITWSSLCNARSCAAADIATATAVQAHVAAEGMISTHLFFISDYEVVDDLSLCLILSVCVETLANNRIIVTQL